MEAQLERRLIYGHLGPKYGVAVSLLLGPIVAVIGLMFFVSGTGIGVETQTFTQITCRMTTTEKGQDVWHCHGVTAEQKAANEAAHERGLADALRGETGLVEKSASTRLLFVDHDGRDDPAVVTASRFPIGDYWIAHSAHLTTNAVVTMLIGVGITAWGGYILRTTRKRGL